ncbi:MAG TPA: lipoyl(octanoyl) transferase LipB [Candidatus Angelobacter sp.]|nr:lipoyl(octanoyl) transferase LipB [Candidatus Angelobacter sp.]
MKQAFQVELGLIGYAEAWELQKRLVAARKADAIEDILLFCEHPHVITLGRNGKRENLLASEHVLRQKGVELHATNRGGDITYHGPGQLVGYPILNLGAIRRDVVWYVRTLEEAMIRATAEFGIAAGREPGKTGVWIDSGSFTSHESPACPELRGVTSLPRASRGHSFTPSVGEGPLATSEKIAAIGVHISRWITSHGFAYNVSTDLRFFDLIVPCGIADRKATSLEKLLGRTVEMEDVAPRIARHLAELFGLQLKALPKKELLRKLEHAEQAVPVSA